MEKNDKIKFESSGLNILIGTPHNPEVWQSRMWNETYNSNLVFLYYRDLEVGRYAKYVTKRAPGEKWGHDIQLYEI